MTQLSGRMDVNEGDSQMASHDEHQADADWEAAADEWEQLTGRRPRPFDSRVGAIIDSRGCAWLCWLPFLLAVVALIIHLAVPGGITEVIQQFGGR